MWGKGVEEGGNCLKRFRARVCFTKTGRRKWGKKQMRRGGKVEKMDP